MKIKHRRRSKKQKPKKRTRSALNVKSLAEVMNTKIFEINSSFRKLHVIFDALNDRVLHMEQRVHIKGRIDGDPFESQRACIKLFSAIITLTPTEILALYDMAITLYRRRMEQKKTQPDET